MDVIFHDILLSGWYPSWKKTFATFSRKNLFFSILIVLSHHFTFHFLFNFLPFSSFNFYGWCNLFVLPHEPYDDQILIHLPYWYSLSDLDLNLDCDLYSFELEFHLHPHHFYCENSVTDIFQQFSALILEFRLILIYLYKIDL